MKPLETEIVIDPFILAWVWNGFAPAELVRERQADGDDPPTDIEEDTYLSDTSSWIFGSDSHLFPDSFLKNTLLYTTRVRTLFSGKKFDYFRDLLFDAVPTKYHPDLQDIRPVFDDPDYSRYRKPVSFDAPRPWDIAARGLDPSELGYGSQSVRFDMSSIDTEGTIARYILRFLNEDGFSEILIEDVLGAAMNEEGPIDISEGFHQVMTDFLAINQYSFGLPYFSFRDASSWLWWTTKGSALKASQEASLNSKVTHAVSVTLPDLKNVSLGEILEIRKHRFFSSYRKLIDSGGLQNMSREDVDKQLWDVMYKEAKKGAPGVTEIIFDIAKAVASFIPGVGTLMDITDPGRSLFSRFRNFKNGWLWFVMDVRDQYGPKNTKGALL